MRNARGLRFLVLDELHTYRGRQGADVALLVRRVREALADNLICIGTSATMATDGTEKERNADGGRSGPAACLVRQFLPRTSSPRPCAVPRPRPRPTKTVAPRLAAAIQAGVPMDLAFDEMARHPVSVWVELTLGLTYESGKPRRARPKTLQQAARLLARGCWAA